MECFETFVEEEFEMNWKKGFDWKFEWNKIEKVWILSNWKIISGLSKVFKIYESWKNLIDTCQSIKNLFF